MNGHPLERKVLILNPQGFHMRPITAFVQLAGRYQSRVTVSRDGRKAADGRSILDLMMLAADHGSVLTLKAEGPDAATALDALAALLQKAPPDE